MNPARGGLVEAVGEQLLRVERSAVRRLQRVSRRLATKPNIRWCCRRSGDGVVATIHGLTQRDLLGPAIAVGRRNERRLMTQQKSEDLKVPEGRRKPVPTTKRSHGESTQDDHPVPLSRKQGVEGESRWGGTGVPVKEADKQLLLPFATAENLRKRRVHEKGDVDLSALPPTWAPKAKIKGGKCGPARLEEVIGRLQEAFVKVAANKGAPGPDRQTIGEVRKHLPELLTALEASLLDGSYRPGDIRRVWIPKGGGGQRGLGIPNVVDRVVQEAIRRVLEPVYEPTFHSSSHGFRPKRGCQTAIAEARKHVGAGYEWVVDLDLAKFFDRVNHQRLMARLSQRIEDERVLVILGRLLKAQVIMPDGVRVQTVEGVPQGGPLSPLLSNIVLSEFDDELERRGHRFVRYADDCNVYVRSERAGQRVMASLVKFLGSRLRLKVNEGKSAVARPETRHFLGYRLVPQGSGLPEVGLSERSKKRLREKIRELTQRNRGQSLLRTISEVNAYLRGWLGHFGVCTQVIEREVQSADAHIRRRLRAIVVKHWKRKRTIAKRLTRLGTRRETAWRRVYSGRKSWWNLSHDPAVERALRNAYFAERGLMSLKETLTTAWARNPAPEQLLLWDTERS